MNTQITLKDLDGSAFKDQTGQPIFIGKTIAKNLVALKTGNSALAYRLAQELYNQPTVTLNPVDKEFIKKALRESQLPDITTGQILLWLDDKLPEPAPVEPNFTTEPTPTV